MHLFGFIIKKFVTMRGHTNVQCIIPPQISPVCHLIVTKQFISTILMFYLSSLLYEY